MYSFRYLAKLSLFLGFCILIVEIRPSSAMPIEGDKNTDKYSAVFDLIAHRLRNLSDVNQDNDQNFRKSFVPERNVTSTVNETLVAQNTSNLNNVTVLSLNGTQKNQSNDQNSRRSYVPMPTGYVGSLLAGNLPADNQMAGNLPARNQVAGNSPSGNQMAGNYPRSQMGSNLPAANQMAENLPAGSQMAGNYPRSQMGGDLLAANQMAGNTATSQIAGYSPAATQLAENSPKSQVAGNLTTISTLAATQMAGNPSRSQMAGNVPVENKMAVNSARSHMASNTPAANQMTGNPPSSQMAGYQSGANQLAGNLPRIQVAGNLPASNTPAVNQMAGNPPKSQIAGYSPIATQRARNFPVTNTPMENQLVRTPNQLAKNPLPFRSNDTKPASNVVSMFPASYNDGPISHEDKSGLYTSLYRQPPSYDRKNTIYRQTSSTPSYYRNVNNYGNISPSSSNIRRSWVKTPGQYTGSYQNYPQQMGHSAPNYQQYYTFPGYPYQQQQWRGGYQGSPGYQVNYPGTSQQSSNGGTKEANDSNLENWDKKFSVPGKFKDSGSYKHDHIPSQKPSTIQRKLAEKPVRKSFSPTTSLSEDSAPSSGISSGSGSGFNEPEDMYPDMEDTSDIQESRALSGSGNDDDIDDENEDLNGDTSNVAFMLAGTNNERNQPPSPSFPVPVPGLPMNLTRKQAIDIYKSALYFAGLLREDNIDNNAAGSGADDIDGDDKIDPKFAAEDDVDADDDVTLTDNDVKEALAASSGELDASGQQASDVDASDSQSVAVVVKPLNKDNAGAVTGDSAPQTTESVTQKVASEPQQEVTQVPSQDNTSQKDDSEAINEKEDALKELGQPDQDGTVEEINAEPVAPTDSEKQASDTTEQANDDNNKEQDDTNEQEDLDSPPPDETKQVSEAQSRYAADQQREKALSYLANTRQRGVFTSASQRTFICKDTTQRISCPPQQRIRILNADYGDTGNVGCLKEANPMPAGMCRTPGAYETVKRHCDGLEDCDLYASNDVFGDVCPDANKYLEVNHDCVNNPANKKFEPAPQQVEKSSPGLRPLVQLPQLLFQVPYAPAPAPGYNQASYQAAPQYVNPPPPPVAYAPAPYQAPPPQAYAPALPNLLPPSPYAAPDPCSPCNTCAQCSLPVCSPCTQTCHVLSCAPRIPAKLQPLWQQWNERTADMSRMEMSALIISPLPKLGSPTKAPETTEASGAAEGSESESGDDTTDEDALYEASKRSGIQRVKSQQKSKKTTLTSHRKAHNKDENEHGFLRNSDIMVSSGDASSGSST